MLIDISSGFMQTCLHPLKQHFSEPEQSSSPWQASAQMPIWSGLGLGQNSGFPSAEANFNIFFYGDFLLFRVSGTVFIIIIIIIIIVIIIIIDYFP